MAFVALHHEPRFNTDERLRSSDERQRKSRPKAARGEAFHHPRIITLGRASHVDYSYDRPPRAAFVRNHVGMRFNMPSTLGATGGSI